LIVSGFLTGETLDDYDERLTNETSIQAVAYDAVKSIGIDNSFFSVDMLLTEGGPLILECGVMLDARIDRLLSFAGINVYKIICKMASGRNIAGIEPRFRKGYALKFMFACRNGKLKIDLKKNIQQGIDGNRVLVEWEKKTGDKVKPPESISDAVGWVISEALNKKEAFKISNDVSESGIYQVF